MIHHNYNRPYGDTENRPPSPENSDPIVNDDPLSSLFAPGKASLLGEETDEVPPEVLDLMESQGLGTKRDFRTVIKSLPEGMNESDYGHAPYIKGFKRSVPSIEWLALNYGPGKYMIQFQWRGTKPDTGKPGNIYENVFVEVSDKFENDYREYQYKKKIENIRKRKEQMKNARLENELEQGIMGKDAEYRDPIETGKQYVKEVVSAARELGLSRGGGNGIEWDKILPPLLSSLPAILGALNSRSNAQREQMQQLYTLLVNQSASSNKELLEVFKANIGRSDSSKAVDDFRNMVMGAIDIKGALMDKKESVSDKIFNMIEKVAPQILQIAMVSQQAREKNPAYHAARGFIDNSPDFQKMAQDPAVLKQVIQRCDEAFGWEQTDMILAVSGFERPEDMPRDPAKKRPYEERESKTDENASEPITELATEAAT